MPAGVSALLDVVGEPATLHPHGPLLHCGGRPREFGRMPETATPRVRCSSPKTRWQRHGVATTGRNPTISSNEDVQSGDRSLPASFHVLFDVVALSFVAVGLVLTWLRLFVGMDLRDESYYVLVPWRWALGDKPFVDEQSLLQIPGFLMYPFVKAFGFIRHYDPTGLVLYSRHLYLLLDIAVAVAMFLLLRRLVRWQLALPTACVLERSSSGPHRN